MSVHIVRIIRELSDRVMPISSAKRSTFCEDLNQLNKVSWEPNTDIMESVEGVLIRCEVAGVVRENICVKLTQGKLIITGVREDRRPAPDVNYHRLEINYGHFTKIIHIPESIEHNVISAQLQDGMLDIHISKSSQAVEIPITFDANAQK